MIYFGHIGVNIKKRFFFRRSQVAAYCGWLFGRDFRLPWILAAVA
jgi:hypothetical protein